MVTTDSSQKSRDSYLGEMHFRTICFYPLSEPVVETFCFNCLRSGRVGGVAYLLGYGYYNLASVFGHQKGVVDPTEKVFLVLIHAQTVVAGRLPRLGPTKGTSGAPLPTAPKPGPKCSC